MIHTIMPTVINKSPHVGSNATNHAFSTGPDFRGGEKKIVASIGEIK